MPTQLPQSAMTNHNHPCKLPEAVPAKKAPILHPNDSRAPMPMIRPPMIAAQICNCGGKLCLRSPLCQHANEAEPIIMPIFITELVFARTD